MTHDDFSDSAVDSRDTADKSECARRSLLRGAVVLGAVGIGGALSRIGSGGYSSPATALASAQTPTAATGADRKSVV